MVSIKIKNQQKLKKIDVKAIKLWAIRALKEQDINSGELSILLVNDRQIARLNKIYLYRNTATDVLAFPVKNEKFLRATAPLLGDIVISCETAARYAKVYKTTFNAELCLYLIHGILHLTGYNDNNVTSQKRMKNRQEEILGQIL